MVSVATFVTRHASCERGMNCRSGSRSSMPGNTVRLCPARIC